MLEMDKGANAWLHKTAAKNLWRVASWYDMGDMLGDGYLTFYRVLRRYDQVRAPAHIMALFKTCYINHVHDLSKKRTRELPELLVCDLIETDDEEALFWTRVLGIELEIATCFTAITHGSPAVVALLSNIASDRGIKALRSHCRLFSDGTRETLNDKFLRIARCEQKLDLVGQLIDVLGD